MHQPTATQSFGLAFVEHQEEPEGHESGDESMPDSDDGEAASDSPAATDETMFKIPVLTCVLCFLNSTVPRSRPPQRERQRWSIMVLAGTDV
jgi:hypothetical protein